jgi:hypothetical protein
MATDRSYPASPSTRSITAANINCMEVVHLESKCLLLIIFYTGTFLIIKILILFIMNYDYIDIYSSQHNHGRESTNETDVVVDSVVNVFLVCLLFLFVLTSKPAFGC